MKLNRVVAEKARALRNKGVPEESIIVQLGNKHTSAELTWHIEELRKYNRAYSKTYYAAVTWRIDCAPIKPDPAAIADRDRRYSIHPASITAALCGDPLPGMSALDRR